MNEQDQQARITTILTAYPDKIVKAAIKVWSRMRAADSITRRAGTVANPWRTLRLGEPVPEGYDYMTLGEVVVVRPPHVPVKKSEETSVDSEPATRNGKATDLSMKPTDRKCPTCGEVMAWEPICAGCALGKMGFRGRYVCMDDFDHTFYVTKPGVEIPNR